MFWNFLEKIFFWSKAMKSQWRENELLRLKNDYDDLERQKKRAGIAFNSELSEAQTTLQLKKDLVGELNPLY